MNQGTKLQSITHPNFSKGKKVGDLQRDQKKRATFTLLRGAEQAIMRIDKLLNPLRTKHSLSRELGYLLPSEGQRGTDGPTKDHE